MSLSLSSWTLRWHKGVYLEEQRLNFFPASKLVIKDERHARLRSLKEGPY